MIDRRIFLGTVATLLALPRAAVAQAAGLGLKPVIRQGELIVGTVDPDATITLGQTRVAVSRDGHFAFGFGYDQKATAILDVRFRDGGTERHEITPALRDYEIQRISGLPETLVTPPADVLERIKRESADLKAAREGVTEASWFADGFDWPVPGIVSSLFGSQRILNGQPRAPHLAVDIAAPTGTPIHAAAQGIVSLTGDLYFDGLFTVLDHGQGVSTCYAHQSRIAVSKGDRIARGQVIGEVGRTGRVTGPNLHWGMNWFQVGLDPSLSTAEPRPPKG
jgi:murein DD-endopeptidase MepM/ murein hydrolase activator NlpD